MKRTVLIFSYVWPETRSSAAGLRTRELIDYFLEEDFSAFVVSPSSESPYRTELENLGVKTIQCDPNEPGASGKIESIKPDLVIYDRFVMEEQFGWRVRELFPDAQELVDTQDFHSLRRFREKLARATPGIPAAKELQWQSFGDDLLRELASLLRAGAALVVSEAEQKILLGPLKFPRERLLLLPFSSIPVEDPAPFSERSGFTFLGNFRHPPNLDCIHFILRELWPGIRKRLPEAELHLYGAYPPFEVSVHKGKGGIFSHGPIMDHRAALSKHRVMLAPLRFGAGIKGKILESWATGTPAVGSWLTFEGMGDAGVGADTLEGLIDLSLRLHEEKSFWEKEQARAIENLKLRFSRGKLKQSLFDFLRELPPSRDHLAGALLRHQQSNSLKYFSRWIEAKQRNQSIT